MHESINLLLLAVQTNPSANSMIHRHSTQVSEWYIEQLDHIVSYNDEFSWETTHQRLPLHHWILEGGPWWISAMTMIGFDNTTQPWHTIDSLANLNGILPNYIHECVSLWLCVTRMITLFLWCVFKCFRISNFEFTINPNAKQNIWYYDIGIWIQLQITILPIISMKYWIEFYQSHNLCNITNQQLQSVIAVCAFSTCGAIADAFAVCKPDDAFGAAAPVWPASPPPWSVLPAERSWSNDKPRLGTFDACCFSISGGSMVPKTVQFSGTTQTSENCYQGPLCSLHRQQIPAHKRCQGEILTMWSPKQNPLSQGKKSPLWTSAKISSLTIIKWKLHTTYNIEYWKIGWQSTVIISVHHWCECIPPIIPPDSICHLLSSGCNAIGRSNFKWTRRD